MTKAKTTTKAKATKTATAEQQLKALQAKYRKLEARTNELEISVLKKNKSKFVLYRETENPDVFFGYICTKNSDGSLSKHKFVKEKSVSKQGNAYYIAYREHVSLEKLAEQKAPTAPKTEAEVTVNNSVC